MTSKIKHLITFLTLVLVVLLFPSAMRAQTRTFTSQNRDYALAFPSTNWRAITVSGVAHDSTEFMYGDQGLVQMRIRRELVDVGVLPSDLVLRQQRSDRVLLRGYVKGAEESFDGRLSGVKYRYEYVNAGRPLAGLIYYLQADDRTIYRIEFSGSLNDLRELGHETDSIARSFRLK
ncbi:MAG TPA: hypothetical protein VJV03_01360 [Pyrinomonadaceae bacterium]|nr:hypothetical protein [Pyrinomonadaceae bacterium]